MLRPLFRVAAFVLLSSAPLFAQGTGAYFNVESPQRKSIAVARVAGHDYLVACNTPDNAIEIYDTHDLAFLRRVQTGAEPISVVWNAALGKLFVCNFLGDSISIVALSAPGSAGPLTATLERTTHVGDEPNHIAFAPDNLSLFVTLGSMHAMGRFLTSNLTPFAAGTEQIDLLDSTGQKAMDQPCTALVSSNKLFVLGHRNGVAGLGYEYGIRVQDLSSNSVTEVNGLGTHSFGMEFAADGDLYVVGTSSGFAMLFGEQDVSTAPFGFAQSRIFKVVGAGGGSAVVTSRDLNADASGTQVLPNQTLAQPTDLALYQPGGVLQKIYVAGFNSDRVGVVSPSAIPSGGTITRVAIPKAPGSINPRSGPRSLAVKLGSGIAGDPGERVYVLNRLDNAISVIDPASDVVLATFALRRDPTPRYIREGREFLYSSSFSANGINSCAGCHLDGRADGLVWELSDFSTQAIPPSLMDGVTNSGGVTVFPQPKGMLVTQSLQGMVNFETPPEVQSLFTNEPLHWRADRATFLDFNPAFVGLLGGPQQLSAAQMGAYRRFVFSIAYPPNPEEPVDRKFSGTLGTATSLADGTGAQRGMKLFHMRGVSASPAASALAGRSCSQCHWLPEGSNNKITLFNVTEANPFDPLLPTIQPIESAALRQIRVKERALEKDGSTASAIRSGLVGLLHDGDQNSINQFVGGTFGTDFAGAGELAALNQFVREFDASVGPLVGRSYSVDSANKALQVTTGQFDLFEGQAKLANSGVALQARLAGVERGFWFDLTLSTPAYREEPGGGAFSRATLLALVAQASDLIVLHATPLGSERRFAWPAAGAPTALSGPAPANIALEPVIPNTAYRDVPLFTKNWIPGTGPDDFQWTGGAVPTPPQLKAVRLFQWGLAQDGPQFGLTALRHEAPRRFRVALDNGRHGARLVLEMGTDPQNPPPSSTTFTTFTFPIHATDQVSAQGRRIWETAVEADALTIYQMMLGGPAAPNVSATLRGTFSPSEPPPVGSYNPSVWNSFQVEVRNEDGSVGSGGWQPLRIL